MSTYSGTYHAAILSFLLPGTGQLFGGRIKLGLIFFCGFIACLASTVTVPVALVVAGVSGVECLSRERSAVPFRMDRRYVLYLVISFLGFILWFFTVGGEFLFGPEAHAADLDLVDLRKVDFTIPIEMHFATEANVAGKKLLPENRCVVRRPVAVALARVQESLKLRDLSLKALDCYHPLSLETKFLEWIPKDKNPKEFAASHPLYRGAWVEVTLVQKDGADVVLPFSTPWVKKERTNLGRAITGATQRKAKANARILNQAMAREGFIADSKWPGSFRYNIWEQFEPSDLPFAEIP